jgi:hypothetical protein
VVTVNVALELPAATTTEAGTEATPALLLDSATVIPPDGAAAASDTVPTAVPPAITEAGLAETEVRRGLTVNVAVFVLPPLEAEIVTLVAVLTPVVVTVNVPVVLPAGIVMLAGTVATVVLLLVSVTTAPPVGAATPSVTVPWLLAPPSTVVGVSTTELSVAPWVVLPPTVSVGSTDAYFRTKTLLNSATVPASPYNATPPVVRLPSVPCTSNTPSLYTAI